MKSPLRKCRGLFVYSYAPTGNTQHKRANRSIVSKVIADSVAETYARSETWLETTGIRNGGGRINRITSAPGKSIVPSTARFRKSSSASITPEIANRIAIRPAVFFQGIYLGTKS